MNYTYTFALFFVGDEGRIKMLHAFSDIVMNGGLVPYGNKDIVYRKNVV